MPRTVKASFKQTLGDRIARAIKREDNSYFYEDYAAQADAVLDAIDEAGFVLVRRNPSREMLEAGAENLTYGRVNKYEMMTRVYRAMVDESLQHPD